jgi:hypothetical protein
MGVRIRYEFTSENEGVEWKCDIHDSDYAASINTAKGNGFQITYNGNGDAPLANVKGSSCRLELLWTDADTFMTGFINDLKAANEHEFALVIYKNNNLYWVGNITGDSLSWGNENTSRSVQIDAIDGLGRLRDMNYDNIIPGIAEDWTDTKQVFEVLLDLLSLNNLDQFWGGSDAYIQFEPHWVLNTSYTDWLDRLSIPRHVFVKTDEVDANVKEPKSAYECLEILLTHLNMRIMHSDGAYWIQQVMGMSTGTAATRYTYYKGNTPVSSSPYKWWQATATSVARNSEVGVDNDILAGGRFSYLPGLQRAELDVPDTFFAFTNIQNTYSKRDLNPTNCPFTESTSLGFIKGGAGKRMQIRINLVGQFKQTGAFKLSAVQNRYYIQLRVKIIAGSYRLYDNGKTDLSDLEWTTTNTSHSVYINQSPARNLYNNSAHIVIETPDIPWTLEDLTMEIEYDIIDPNTGASYNPSPVPYIASIKNVAVTYVDDYGIITRSKLAINNPAITDYENNTMYKHPNYLLDDVGIVTNQNAFQLNTTTTTFADVSGVDSGHLTDELISETILQDAMSLQMYPIQLYEGAITGIYEPYLTWEYDLNYYVFNGGSFDAKFDEWNCQWWQSSPELGTIGNPARDDGKGFEYDGDERYKPYTRIPTPWDHYGDVKDVMYLEKIGGSGGNYNSSLSSLTIQSATESLLKSGDVVCVFNPDTLEKLGQFTLTSNINSGNTSMAFSSSTLTENIPPDAIVMLKGSEGTATPMLRTNEIQIGGQSITSLHQVSWASIGTDNKTVTPTALDTVTYVPFTGTAYNDLKDFSFDSSDGKLTYTGSVIKWFEFLIEVEYNITATSPDGTVILEFGISGGSTVWYNLTNPPRERDQPHTVTMINRPTALANGDSFRFYFKNSNVNKDIFFSHIKIFVKSFDNY